MSFVGARWWKFDFHTHTPASMDYGKGDSSLAGSMNPRDWLLDFINNGIECVAVTDHNSGEWIDNLNAEAKKLRDEGHNIFVFPGVEISANSGIHVLGIFDPNCTSASISAVIGACKFRGTHGDSDSVTEESAENVIKEIISAGGVAIPAHIDMKAGLCQQTSSHTIRQVCDVASAVEIIFPDRDSADAPLSRFTNLNIDLPSVIGSDSHRPRDVGRAFTWVKMSSPSIEGLKLAMVDGGPSLIRSDELDGDPNQSSNTLLKSVTIENAKYAGRVSPLIIEFNPWLNSIIGGRGSGKSSVLEFIRLGMDRSVDFANLSVDNEIRKSFDNFTKVSTSRETQGVILQNTKITCIYSRDNVDYRLIWTNQDRKVSISRFDGANFIPENGEACSRFPIKIFSQKQIFDLAKNPNTLLRLIDESSTVGFQQWKMDWDEKCRHFQTLCAQRREKYSKGQNKNVLQGQLSDVEQKIKTIEQSGHAEILKNFQSFRAKKSSIVEFEKSIEGIKNLAENLTESIILPNVEQSLFDSENSSEQEVLQRVATLNQSTSDFRARINDAISLIDDELKGFASWYASSDFNNAHTAADDEYNSLIESLVSQGITSPAEYSQLVEDRDKINKSLDDLSKLEAELTVIHVLVNNAFLALVESRKQLTLNRIDFLNTYLSTNASIKVEITPFSDLDSLDATFRKAIGRPDNAFASEIFDPDRETGFLFELNKQLLAVNKKPDASNINLWAEIIDKFKLEFLEAEKGQILGTKLGKRFSDYLEQMPIQNFDAVNTWFPEDKLIIKFYDGNRFKDVSQGSAGQKASAILSFLLSYGTEPLILDQPEDDLDNGLITSLIVSKLHDNKAFRQIIVVTHNPNIVVNGDSEYVIALEDSGQIKKLASGALQEISVRKNVCEIMEGGEIALQKRYKRMFNI